MNARLALAAALAALLPFAASAATQNLTVSATVSSVCTVTAPAALSYTIDPSAVAGALNTQKATITYKCTKKGAAPSFTVGGDSSGTYAGNLSNGSASLPFTLTWPTASVVAPGGFSGAGNTVDITFNISQTDAQDAQAGNYTVAPIAIVVNP